MRVFDTVLIANRGEIACRIIRTLHDMELRAVAVYSDADKDAPHVQQADQAVHIGASPATESYLVADKIIKAAKQSGAQAIHPGYGFLSENADFARACDAAGLVFIGPSPDAIAAMGDKAVAKRRMLDAGVPCVPGYQGAAQDDATLIQEAKAIGYPLLVKAAAGGGGRGMRLVEHSKDLLDALTDARVEALSAFGSDTLILERAVPNARHVEVQIFGDTQGTILHLGERDCSVQRRHQKIIEEAPCPVMTPELREEMAAAAVAAARSVDYVGAGTVEFLLDAAGVFYFLEMNTRLQVEHPVTEMITGLDLVALQIHIAQGTPLGLSQDDIELNGHAIEVRLYAEDPAQDFLPQTGTLDRFDLLSDLRVDSGVVTGSTVSPFYDPMLAKVIAHGPDRETARRKIVGALQEAAVFGLTTNRNFLLRVLQDESFAAGEATTQFLSDTTLTDAPTLSAQDAALAAVSQFQIARDLAARRGTAKGVPGALLNWTSATALPTPFIYDDLRAEVTPSGRHSYRVDVAGERFEIDCISRAGDRAVFEIAGNRQTVRAMATNGAQLHIAFADRQFTLTNRVRTYAQQDAVLGKGELRAPLHGALIEIFVETGDHVKAGDRLALLEAMKMQHEILADIDGTVAMIHAEAGAQIAADAPLFEISPDAQGDG